MPIKLTKQTDQALAKSVREGSFRSADEVIREGIALVRARQAFRLAVQEGAAYADRGELLDGEQAFEDVEVELREAKQRQRR